MTSAPHYLRRMRPTLGTYVEVGVEVGVEIGTPMSESATHAIDAAFARIDEVQRSLSFHDPHSELSRLNAAGGQPVPLSWLALKVLRLARAMTRASQGLFNCTVGGALVARGALPDHGGEAPLQEGVADDIEIHAHHARLRRPVRITLDGIAKGFAVDLAVRELQRHGMNSGWVNAGGDLRAFGDCIVPVRQRGESAARSGLQNAALATSSASADPSFHAVIVDAQGCEVTAGAWSVMARRAWRADALTKVAALANATQRAALIEQLGGRLVHVRAA